MRFREYSHRHGKELCQLLHPSIHDEIVGTLSYLEPFPHGLKKRETVKVHVAEAFKAKGWQAEGRCDFGGDKRDFLDLVKWKVAIEMEWSKFEMFFRDFFRFMLLYERKEVDVGVILTYADEAYARWEGEAKPYASSRASLARLTDFLKGDYSTVVRVPLWCIGIE